MKPDWDLITKDGLPPEYASPWNHHPFLAAAAAAAHAAASNQSHLRPGYCDTPDGARTPVEDPDSEASPPGSTALEFATVVCNSANSSKWANGVRVRTGMRHKNNAGGPFLGPFPSDPSQMETTFSHPWRHPMQKSISMPVSPVSSRMKGSFGERLGRCPSELELSGGLGCLWELDHGTTPRAMVTEIGAKRKLSADDLELTLGSSSLRASPEHS